MCIGGADIVTMVVMHVDTCFTGSVSERRDAHLVNVP